MGITHQWHPSVYANLQGRLENLRGGERPDLPALHAQSSGWTEGMDRVEPEARAHTELLHWNQREKQRKMVAAILGKSKVCAVTDRETGQMWSRLGDEWSEVLGHWGSPGEVLRTVPASREFLTRLAGEEMREPGAGSPSLAVVGVDMPAGTLRTPGRSMRDSWVVDCDRESKRVAQCCSGAIVTKGSEGAISSVPISCGSRVCPQCIAKGGREYLASHDPVIQRFAAAGHPIVHVTATGRTDDTGPWPVLLTDEEVAAGYVADRRASAGAPGHSVPGESLPDAIARVRGWFYDLRQGKGTAGNEAKRWYHDNVVGFIYAVEVTGRRFGKPPWRPRWHAHLHILLVLRKDVEIQTEWVHKRGKRREAVCGEFWDGWVEHWCNASGGQATPAGQWGTPVHGDPKDVAATLREVIKYPAKMSSMTDAQLVEWLCYIKGGRTSNVGGQFHGGSKVGCMALQLKQLDEDDWEDVPDWGGELWLLEEASTHPQAHPSLVRAGKFARSLLLDRQEWTNEASRLLAQGWIERDSPPDAGVLYRRETPDEAKDARPQMSGRVRGTAEDAEPWDEDVAWRVVTVSWVADSIRRFGVTATVEVTRADPVTAQLGPVTCHDAMRMIEDLSRSPYESTGPPDD